MIDEDKLRKIVANAEEQLALAHNYNWKQGCEWLLTDLQQLLAKNQRLPLEDFKAHTEAVSRFLNDLYATMIDPCATGTITVGEMCRQLLAQAEKDREALRELHELKTSLAERPPPQEAQNEEITPLVNQIERLKRNSDSRGKAGFEDDQESLRNKALDKAIQLCALLRRRKIAGPRVEPLESPTP